MYVDNANTPTPLWIFCHNFISGQKEKYHIGVPPPPERLFHGWRSLELFCHPKANTLTPPLHCGIQAVSQNEIENGIALTKTKQQRKTYSVYTLLEAVCHFRSVVMDAGSRGTTAHAHQCCIFQSYAKTVPSRMKWTMREPTNHDNGQGVTASDVILQQRSKRSGRGGLTVTWAGILISILSSVPLCKS